MLRRTHYQISQDGIGNVSNIDKVLYWLKIEDKTELIKVKAMLAYKYSHGLDFDNLPDKYQEGVDIYKYYVTIREIMK